jgi:Cell division protein
MLTGIGHKAPAEFAASKNVIDDLKGDDFWHAATLSAQALAEKFNIPSAKENMRRMKELATSPTQDWEKIVEAQERRDAKDAEKALRKAEKAAAKETPRPQPVKPVEAPVSKPEPVQEPVAVVVPEPEPVIQAEPAPLTWRDTWSSKNYDPNYFNQFGRRLNEESKRDLFGVDSLAKHWVRQLEPEREFLDANIRTPLERAHYRHAATNYNTISEEFEKDLKKNIESGNIPGTAIRFLQKFKQNSPVPGRTTPTLVLELSEKPRPVNNPRFWADEAEGPDLYEMLFRPMVDRKLNAKNRTYWE